MKNKKIMDKNIIFPKKKNSQKSPTNSQSNFGEVAEWLNAIAC